MVMPIRGQYEQLCNAAALKKLGVPVLKEIDDDFGDQVRHWAEDPFIPEVSYQQDTDNIVQTVMTRATGLSFELDIPYPDLIFN